MQFKAGDKLTVRCSRRGTYLAVATKDFDTEADEWYPVTLDQEYLEGSSTYWERGDEVPCRRGLAIVMTRGGA